MVEKTIENPYTYYGLMILWLPLLVVTAVLITFGAFCFGLVAFIRYGPQAFSKAYYAVINGVINGIYTLIGE